MKYSSNSLWNKFTEKKRLFLSIYKPPSQSNQYSLDSLSEIIGYYPNVYNYHITLADFNMDPSQMLSAFMDTHNYATPIRNNTCFKGQGSCIDSTLGVRKYCFKHTESFETGLNDHHHLINNMLKTLIERRRLETIIYCDFKQFELEPLEKYLIHSSFNRDFEPNEKK